ncbi:MAG: hypothetical protein COB38_00340 [Gammaproteobacteria bacterium]|nr:MAG: hypothetical protein COB38_00340 [Gammaproteobacteria bacterium]
MNEKIIQFGDNQNLIGILSSPESIQKDKPIFIFVNSGLLHRVGPFRIYVATARELAKQQFTSLRMDLSGKGDSLAKQNSLSLKENTNQDIIDAMDYLQESTGVSQFVVCGICTGADNAYEIAFSDERIKGVIPIDGYAYPTAKFHFKKLYLRLTNSNSWRNLVSKFLPFIVKKDVKISRLNKSDVTMNYKMIFPEKSVFENKLSQTLNRGSKFLVIFTGGWYMFYNYKHQFKKAIGDLFSEDKIKVEHNKKSDHTFILQKDKEWLISTIVGWAKRNF